MHAAPTNGYRTRKLAYPQIHEMTLMKTDSQLKKDINAELEWEPAVHAERIDDPQKSWKFSAADIQERKFWPSYMTAYEQCLSATSTRDSPWYVVPADDKNNSRLIVSQIVLETFRAMDLSYPQVDPVRRKELKAFRSELTR